ncbi:hypothetical protein NG798_24565 [Ancylothrix sp. C2]|uniref:hypothetical protein n=1 Tax=Ancylothrix sp. D3o TaxID=2953691 RepID=UPI0021BA5180|nr:hypothetical protein [Ancylothrix sp. D3o]MCT7952976.1 hypothetical protein [Ancylothrix sp. D3o]
MSVVLRNLFMFIWVPVGYCMGRCPPGVPIISPQRGETGYRPRSHTNTAPEIIAFYGRIEELRNWV